MGIHQIEFLDVEDLLDRLDGVKDPVLIVGSAISMPLISGVGGMIDRVRQALSSERQAAKLATALADAENPYQAAFGRLITVHGMDAANAVIQDAVLDARLRKDGAADRETDQDFAGWQLTPGVEALGRWVAKRNDEVTILTTNFDPLIESAIRQAGGQCYSSVLQVDGGLDAAHGIGAHVVHVHGYWLGDTLHTATQLTAGRPRLHQSLQTACRGRPVTVLGYGGWDDAISKALWQLAYDTQAGTDVLWTFYEDDTAAVEARYFHVFRGLQAIVPGRVQFYKDIDVHTMLPKLAGQAPTPPPPTCLTEAELEQVIDWALDEDLPGRRGVLMGRFDKRTERSILDGKTPLDQLRNDLRHFNDPTVVVEGRPAIAVWLAQANRMSIRTHCKDGFEALRARVET